jgi:hypothetical protein
MGYRRREKINPARSADRPSSTPSRSFMTKVEEALRKTMKETEKSEDNAYPRTFSEVTESSRPNDFGLHKAVLRGIWGSRSSRSLEGTQKTSLFSCSGPSLHGYSQDG